MGGKRLTLAAVAAFALLAALAPAAVANPITVNSTDDDIDDDGNCTLREAIDAAGLDTASGAMSGECVAGAAGLDTIGFTAAFNGEAADTITAGSALPTSFDDVTIDGGNCGTVAQPKPCVGVNFTAGGVGPSVNDATATVTVRGLAITGASDGIRSYDGKVIVGGSWLGRKLDGTTGGNTASIRLDGSGSTIGGTTSVDRNLIVASTIGIYSFGGDSNTITGNYFSTAPDGTLLSGHENGTNIRIVDDGAGPDPATGNVIGGADSGTPTVCDGACNLIASANGDGIDLAGTGGAEGGATGPTTIKGNFIGLNAAGTAGIGNGDLAIDIGDADSATVGGAGAADRNYLADNGSQGLFAAAGATSLLVQNNFFGLSSDGGTAIPDGTGQVTAQEISSQTSGASFQDNRFGPAQVVLGGSGATFQGNVLGIGTGGEDVGPDGDSLIVSGTGGHQIGGTSAGDGNTIGNSGDSSAAIAVNGGSDNNVLEGNFVGADSTGAAHPNGGTGIVLGLAGAVTGNTIGGTTAVAENVVSNSNDDAIRLVGDGTDGNDLLRNRGFDNGSVAGDLFYELQGTSGAGNGASGPNNAIEAPAVTSATTTTITGTSTEAMGTVVRVYRTFTNRGDLKDFVGQTTVDGSGNWSLPYGSPLGNGTCITANQTDATDGSSELAPTTTIGGGACDVTLPVASFASGPTGTIKGPIATFGFASNEAGSTFECRVDSDPFMPCSALFTTLPLTNGPHTVHVRAIDPADNIGLEASRSFSIDGLAPQTTITGVKRKVRRRKATVSFSSNEAGSTFMCKLDGKPFAPCSSPKTYRRLKRGRKHTIRVKAIDAVGNVDGTPASAKVRIPRAQ